MSCDDNLTRQIEEIEALSSIYGDDWCVVDEAARNYCIQVTAACGTSNNVSLCLQVHMPVDYPLEAPPQYELNAPWLRGEERRSLAASLEDIYCENLGESVIFMWVERLRGYLQDRPQRESGETVTDASTSGHVRLVTKTAESEDDMADDFSNIHIGYADVDQLSVENFMPMASEVLECPLIHHGDIVTERRSTFQPHLAQIFFKQQVKLVMDKLYENKKIANATHNIMAYRISRADPIPVLLQGCEDDGETHAGSRMLHLMQILDASDVIVVVSRWYGGILLGPDRFKLINNCTRTILEQHGYIGDKGEKKGPKSRKMKR